jgi:Mg-chelatase subunit ChlD
MTSQECSGRFGTRIEAAKWAVKQFTDHNVPPDVNLGLYVFDGTGTRERVPLGKGNRNNITEAIDRVRGGGNTPLNAAIRTAVAQLSAQRERQLGYGEFYVVVATDGEATDGDLSRNAVSEAVQKAIPIITIGFCLPGGHPLASGSIAYRNANSPEELLSALRETQGESPYFDQTVFQR